MNAKTKKLIAIMLVLACAAVTQARIKLVALPERAATVVRLDNPTATLIEEERVLTLGLSRLNMLMDIFGKSPLILLQPESQDLV